MKSRRALGMGLPLTVTALEGGAFGAAVWAQAGVATHRDSAASRRTERENMMIPSFEIEIIAHRGRRPEWREREFHAASKTPVQRRSSCVARACRGRRSGAR